MPKGIFPFLTVKDLQNRLIPYFEKVGRKAPSRPTLYRLEGRGIWKPTKSGANNWRIFNDIDLDKAVDSVLKEYAIK